MNDNPRKTAISQQFEATFHQPPQVWGRAPGRVDLMGSHTDYNLGYVMTMTIDRDTWIAAAPRTDRQVEVYSMNLESSGRAASSSGGSARSALSGGAFSLDPIEHAKQARWTNYIRGMAKILQEAGYPLSGWNGIIHSTVPFASGLSSSAALEMAAGVIFQAVGGFIVDPVSLARLGQKAENQFVGVNSGILDQYSSAMGQAGSSLLLDCRTLKSQLTPIAEGITVMICDTRSKRSLAGTEYGERRAQCEEGVRILQQFFPGISALRDVTPAMFVLHEQDLPEIVARRCRFIVEEDQRVLDLAGALAIGDRARLHELFTQSFAGARDLYEISAPAMEAMMMAMTKSPGVIGARQAGAGFGGCMVALVEADQVEPFTRGVQQQYDASTGIQPAIYPVAAAPGAGLL